jgi:hypothetical protein
MGAGGERGSRSGHDPLPAAVCLTSRVPRDRERAATRWETVGLELTAWFPAERFGAPPIAARLARAASVCRAKWGAALAALARSSYACVESVPEKLEQECGFDRRSCPRANDDGHLRGPRLWRRMSE